MCEIFVLINTKNEKLNKEQVSRFLEACLPAAQENNDGWGAFWEKPDFHGMVKSPEQFTSKDIIKILERYRGSRFIALHLRKATSNVCYTNTHPFHINGFRGCHNGVVKVEGMSNDCDSLNMFEYINNQPGEISDRILKGMSKVSGTYSVLIHDINKDRLFYYRNTPCFDFMLDKANGLVYGATRIGRLKPLIPQLHGMFSDCLYSEPHERTLYEITLGTGDFRVVGRIPEYKPVYQFSWKPHNHGYSSDHHGGV